MLLGYIVRLELIDIGPTTLGDLISALCALQHAKIEGVGKQAEAKTFGVRIAKCSAIHLVNVCPLA